MTVKIGNAEIDTISIIEPYGYDITGYVEDTPDTWTRPSEWLDMPSVVSGVAALIIVPSGADDFGVSIQARGPGSSSNCPTHISIDWGDGTSDFIHGTRADNVTNVGGFGYFHKRYDFNLLPESSQFTHGGQLVRQALIQLDASASGLAYFNAQGMNGRYFGSQSSYGVSNYYTDADGSIVNTTQRSSVVDNAASPLLDLHIDTSDSLSLALYGWNTIIHKNCENVNINASGISPTYAFQEMINLRNISLNSDITLVGTSILAMFKNCKRLLSAPMMDTSSITSMQEAFNGCFALRDIPAYDTSNVTNFTSMFSNCYSLKTIPSLDYSSGTNFSSFFYGNPNITHVPSGLDFSSATNCSSMFRECRNMAVIPNIDLTNVTTIESMFQNCASLSHNLVIDAPSLTTNGIQNLFNGCRAIDRVHIKNIGSATSLNGTFAYCSSLRKIVWDNEDSLQPTNMSSTYLSCESLANFPNFDTSQNTNFANTWNGCQSLVSLPTLDLSSATNCGSIFRDCKKLERANFVNVLNRPSFYTGFNGCNRLEKAPSGVLQDYNSTPSSMDYMFIGCSQLKDISEYVISGVGNCFQPFNGCSSLAAGPRDINTNNMAYLFTTCQGLESIGAFDFSMVTNMTATFSNCQSLRTFDAYGMNVSIPLDNCNLSSGEITKIFNNLASGVTGQTINVRNNYGTPLLHSDTIAIATSKGWTVTT